MRGLYRGVGVALAIGAIACAVFAAPAGASLQYFGVNTGQAIRALPELNQNPNLFYSRLTGMGGNVLREDVNWNQVEPQNNTWDWSYLDKEIGAAPAGVGVILMFLNSPGWVRDPVENLIACNVASPATCRMPPAKTKLNEWMDLVRTTVSRYRSRVVGVEVWNEPNYKNFWRPNGDEPARWAGLVQLAAQATAEVDPTIPIITGGLGAALKSNPDAAPNIGMEQKDYLTAAYNSLPSLPQYVDGIGIHAYPSQTAPNDPSAYNRYLGTLSEIRSVRDARDPTKPLWVTETGYYTRGQYAVTETQQRDWLLQIYNELNAATDVKAMIIHTLFEPTWLTNNDVETSYGLVYPGGTDGSGTPKPAWSGFHNLFFPGG
jgi:hypothetical protein